MLNDFEKQHIEYLMDGETYNRSGRKFESFREGLETTIQAAIR